MRRRLAIVSGCAALLLVGAACDRGEDTPGTTSATIATENGPDATAAPSGGTAAEADGTTATTTAPPTTTETTDDETTVAGMPTYEVAETIETDDGDSLVVVVEPGVYSNVELENLVYDIVERFEPVEAVVVDDPAAVPLLLADVVTPEENDFLESHTFLRLADGVEVTFLGPYSDVTGLVIGS